MTKKLQKPEPELVQELQAAAKRVTVGSRYVHFRHPENKYTVLNIVWDTTTEEPSVVYRAEYGAGLTFCRPVRIWLESVEHEGKIIPRFTEA
jgi:hypothetical protein